MYAVTDVEQAVWCAEYNALYADQTTTSHATTQYQPELWSQLPGEMKNMIYRALLDNIVLSGESTVTDAWQKLPSPLTYDFRPYRALLLTSSEVCREIRPIFETEYLSKLHSHFDDMDLLKRHALKIRGLFVPKHYNPTFTLRAEFWHVDKGSEHSLHPPLAPEKLIGTFPTNLHHTVDEAYNLSFSISAQPYHAEIVSADDGSTFVSVQEKGVHGWTKLPRFTRIKTFIPENGMTRRRYVHDLLEGDRLRGDTLSEPIRSLLIEQIEQSQAGRKRTRWYLQRPCSSRR